MPVNDKYSKICGAIEAATAKAGRPAHSVKLLAVSKKQPLAAIHQLARLGQRDFGENYLQEAIDKVLAPSDYNLVWHFIGQVQANKTRSIATHFDWVHSVDRLKIARRLSDQRDESAPPLNVCIEVNVDNEARKGGVAIEELRDFVDEVSTLPQLRLRGLMALPASSADVSVQRSAFRRLAKALRSLQQPALDTLSMGTSADFEAAIAEGSTIVRVGTALFGPRSN